MGIKKDKPGREGQERVRSVEGSLSVKCLQAIQMETRDAQGALQYLAQEQAVGGDRAKAHQYHRNKRLTRDSVQRT